MSDVEQVVSSESVALGKGQGSGKVQKVSGDVLNDEEAFKKLLEFDDGTSSCWQGAQHDLLTCVRQLGYFYVAILSLRQNCLIFCACCGVFGIWVCVSLPLPRFCSSPAGGVCGRGRGWLPRWSKRGTPVITLTNHPLHKSLVLTPLLCQLIPSCSVARLHVCSWASLLFLFR